MSAPAARVLAAARVMTPHELLAPGWLALRDGRVAGLGAGAPPAALGPAVELGDRICAPGFVDLHVHGGDGAQVNAATAGEAAAGVRRLARFHARHGTTALLPTTVSDTPERTRESVLGIVQAMGDADPEGARVLGAHVEGPWLSPARAGAQDPAMLRDPDLAELEELLAAGEGAIRIVTLAPELPGALELVGRLVAAGVVPSLGHTEADLATATRAFDLGARHVAHLFNAMAPLRHRAPGIAGAALTRADATVELIADGHHVHPTALALAAGAAATPVLVTDATPAAGLPDGPHRLGSLDIVLEDGAVTLAGDRATLAGSALTMDRAVRTFADAAGVPLADAFAAASASPAAVVCADGLELGRLAPGCAADVVVLEPDLSVAATIVRGRPVHDPQGLLERG